MAKKERLYKYTCKVGDKWFTGVLWHFSKEQAIKDVQSNYGRDAKRVTVQWLKEGSLEFNLALIEHPHARKVVQQG